MMRVVRLGNCCSSTSRTLVPHIAVGSSLIIVRLPSTLTLKSRWRTQPAELKVDLDRVTIKMRSDYIFQFHLRAYTPVAVTNILGSASAPNGCLNRREESDMPVATTRLPDEVSKYLANRAKITGESVSDQLRQAAEEWIARQNPEELLKAHKALMAEREKAVKEMVELQKSLQPHR
jgi:hypothetical protein